jgi:hypothetical protein
MYSAVRKQQATHSGKSESQAGKAGDKKESEIWGKNVPGQQNSRWKALFSHYPDETGAIITSSQRRKPDSARLTDSPDRVRATM